MDIEEKPPLFSPKPEAPPKKGGKPDAEPLQRDASITSIPGSDLLSDAEIAEIKAKSQDKAKQEVKAQALKELSDKFDKQERHRIDPNEELETVMIDVPGFAAINKNGTGIMVDGIMYQHGVSYTLPRRQVQAIKDIVAQAWAHESETGGASRDIYRRPKNSVISPRGGVTTSNLMRV